MCDAAHAARRQLLKQDLRRVCQVVGPAVGAGVVEADDKAGTRCRTQPRLDGIPGCEQVGKRHEAEVVHEGRAQKRRSSRGGGDTGHDLHLDCVCQAHVLGEFENEARHAVDARVA